MFCVNDKDEFSYRDLVKEFIVLDEVKVFGLLNLIRSRFLDE